MSVGAPVALTDEQRPIVEWGEGPLVVIAGAGTGKTRVIVERVRRLLATQGETAWPTAEGEGEAVPAEPGRHDPPFSGPLVPEQILVLTYNVKAARELQERLEKALGPTVNARLAVSNFHSFCHRILTEHAADAGLAGHPDVLDGVGQLLLLRDLWPDLALVYHSSRGGEGGWWLGQFVAFINRAKDELVTPDAVDAFVEGEVRAFEQVHGPLEPAVERLRSLGNLRPARAVRSDYARLRAARRARTAAGTFTTADGPEATGGPTAEATGGTATTDLTTAMEKTADREARRTMDGEGHARSIRTFTPEAGRSRAGSRVAPRSISRHAGRVRRLHAGRSDPVLTR